MTPAEQMREQCAVETEGFVRQALDAADGGAASWLSEAVEAIRALPLPEEALTLLARDVAREWRDYRDDGSLLVPHEAFIDALTALLDAMAEGWDVVEEGEGDG